MLYDIVDRKPATKPCTMVFIMAVLLLCVLLTACSGRTIDRINQEIGEIGFQDDSILTKEEKGIVEALRFRREEAIIKKDVKALEAIQGEWNSLKTSVEARVSKIEITQEKAPTQVLVTTYPPVPSTAVSTAAPTVPSAATSTSAPTSALTEASTVPSTVAPTEAPTAPSTAAPPTEPPTEAPTEPPTDAPTEPATKAVRQFRDGEIVRFGHFEQDNNLNNGAEEIEWIVMGVFDGYVDLLSCYILDVVPYHNEYTTVTYDKSDIHKYLNSAFLHSSFSAQEQSFMLELTLPPTLNPEYSETDQGREVKGKVYLPSLSKAIEFFTTDERLRCAGTAYAKARGLHVGETGGSPWWTRTMGADAFNAAIIRNNGLVNYEGWNVTGADYYDIGFRPCIRVSTEALQGQ